MKPKHVRYPFVVGKLEDVRPWQDGAFHILEIGTHNGDTAIRLCKRARQLHPGRKIRYSGIDLFEDFNEKTKKKEFCGPKKPPKRAEVAAKILSKIKRWGCADLYKGHSHDVLDMFVMTPGGPYFDFVFIDGGHDVDTIRGDWHRVSRLIHAGSVVVFDDYYSEREDVGASEVIDAIRGDQGWSVDFSEPQWEPRGKITIQAVSVRDKVL